jgi:hypothetical protein
MRAGLRNGLRQQGFCALHQKVQDAEFFSVVIRG